MKLTPAQAFCNAMRRIAGGPFCGECGECFADKPNAALWTHLRRVHAIGPYKLLQQRVRELEALINTPEVEEFSIHTPDLDDVFLALTGHASAEENTR